MSSTMFAPAAPRTVPRVRDSSFYLGFAIASAVVVFAGFSRTYYLKAYFNTPRLPLLFHIHGMVFTLWMLLFVIQTWLVWDGRFSLHRQLGMAAAVLASLMFVLGVAVAFVAGAMGHFSAIPGARDAAQGCLFALFDITLFSAFVWAGFLWRSNGDVHSRLMLLATAIGLLPSAIGRLANNKPGAAVPIILIFVFAGSMYDLITRRKIHATYLFGIAMFLLMGPPLRLLLGRTALWHRLFAHALALGS
jgi:uncharacterized membrane protein YozB (DUF420 family)